MCQTRGQQISCDWLRLQSVMILIHKQHTWYVSGLRCKCLGLSVGDLMGDWLGESRGDGTSDDGGDWLESVLFLEN